VRGDVGVVEHFQTLTVGQQSCPTADCLLRVIAKATGAGHVAFVKTQADPNAPASYAIRLWRPSKDPAVDEPDTTYTRDKDGVEGGDRDLVIKAVAPVRI